ncbi:hypothetical protein H5201_05120 [Pseudoalteromonas sp. SG43-6]|uniref:hypothetical protein n=1 Tax=Pseudoalteromonas sp. SG43-6 TaxID=2760967 RepID=UPI0015FFB452|nr:hypothetical protein [Pseudoalteromonas sp. SG43-6]MBB1433680.1 hypothetical protein [Pseudoalteromonas sp. SG43-6]
MQFIKRFLKILILLLILTGLSFALFSFYLWIQSAEPITSRSDEETRSNVQWLSTEKPLIFSFSSTRTHSIRVLSNAIFSEPQDLDKPINYAIEYAFLNEKKQVISSHVYHHASKLTPPDNEQQIKQIIENRQALQVSSGQSFYISPEQLKNVTSVSLKLISEDSQVMGVVVRVHAKTHNDNDDKYSAWLKLPLERRERSSAYHSIGVNALSTTEINNAVTYSWLKLAPQGIPGIDFKADILYETLPYNVVTYDFAQQQLNLNDYYTDATLCASIELKQPDSLIFSLDKSAEINLTWYDLSQFIAPHTVLYRANTAQPLSFITEPLDIGLVTICSTEPLLSNWSFSSLQPLTTAQDGYYQISNLLNARFTLEGSSDINIDLRSSSRGHATVIVYDQDNQPIDTFTISYDDELSEFDRVILDSTQREKIPKANSFYLRLNERAAALVITTEQPTLVRVKSRNSQFNYQRTVCHTKCIEDPNFHDIAAWYEQQADNHYDFTEQDSYVNIRVFQEPPEILIKDSFYQSRELFKQLPISNVALVNSPTKYFTPVTEPSPYNFAPLQNKHLLQAATNAPSTDPGSVVYQLNNKTAREVNLVDTDFEQLASIEKNAQQIYQNWQGQRPWLKQRLYKLTANTPLKLAYPTQRPYSVVLKAYSHYAEQSIILDIAQRAKYQSGLTHDYSIANKRYGLQPSRLSDAFLIHPKDSQLFAYPAITQQLNADVRALNSLTITSNKTVWIEVLEEYANEEVKIRWWNDDAS